MARSYFSRLMQNSAASPLMPPRPISSLWKSARLERATTEIEESTGAPKGRLSEKVFPITRSALSTQTLREGITPSPASKPAAAVNKARFSKLRLGDADEAIISYTPPRQSWKRDLQMNEKALNAGEARPTGRPRESRGQSGEVANRGQQTIEANHDSEHPGAAPLPAPIGRPQIEVQDDRDRSAATRLDATLEPPSQRAHRPNSTTRTEERPEAAPSNAIRIGKIELQVVAPPAAVRTIQPVRQNARLARGYALGTSWQQLER